MMIIIIIIKKRRIDHIFGWYFGAARVKTKVRVIFFLFAWFLCVMLMTLMMTARAVLSSLSTNCTTKKNTHAREVFVVVAAERFLSLLCASWVVFSTTFTHTHTHTNKSKHPPNKQEPLAAAQLLCSMAAV